MTNQTTPVQGGATEEQIEAAAATYYAQWESSRTWAEVVEKWPAVAQEWRDDVRPILEAGLSASASAHSSDEHHHAKEREAESEDHAATVTGDHEKLIAEALDTDEYRVTPDSYYGTETDEEAEAKAQGFNAAMEIVEPYMQRLAALAAPVEVDEAKLAEILRDCETSRLGGFVGVVRWEHKAEAKAIAERRAEWLRGEGR